MDGVSLAGVLTGLQPALERPYFIYNPAHDEVGQISVRLGDYKLIRSYSPQWPSQLYNLREDLGETRNLAAERPEKLAELSALIDRFFAQTGAPVPRPNPRYRPVEGTAGAVEDEDGQPTRLRQRKASQPTAKPSEEAL
jgi:arylsulfatase A-like enzyme